MTRITEFDSHWSNESSRGLDEVTRDWADSGLMALTGRADGAPCLLQRDHIGRIAALCKRYALLSGQLGQAIDISPALLGERAALSGLSRQGRIAAGGKSRLVRSADGWVALTLARAEDIDDLPAWLGCSVSGDVWASVEHQISQRATGELVEAGQLLGIPMAALTRRHVATPYRWTTTHGAVPRTDAPVARAPLVLDFSSLWAGPLCADLLARAGARVIKIESSSRPDGARFGDRAFFDLLHHGHEMLSVDFSKADERAHVHRLMHRADIIIEASRPRAFAQLGLAPQQFLAARRGLTWISITAYGRSGTRSNWVGLGDDVAAGAGLVAFDDADTPCFIGDAMADPVTGIAAAIGALEAHLGGGGKLVDVAMHRAAAWVACAPRCARAGEAVSMEVHDGRWSARIGARLHAIRRPWSRAPTGPAKPSGADNAALSHAFA